MSRRDEHGIWRTAGTSQLGPRKVVVGTVARGFWGRFPGLPKRLAELTGIVDRMAGMARRRYGRGLDLAVHPESAVNDEPGSDAFSSSSPFAGQVHEVFARTARRHRCYIVIGMNLLENESRKICANAAVLVDRRGRLAGIYRKMHPVPSRPGLPVSLEGGMTPGRAAPVFHCDFGRLGMQICYDVEFPEGWNELARQNADIVAWPTQSPQLARPSAHALRHGFHVVSSTWKCNASVFDPMGKVVAQVRTPGIPLVAEIDLSWALLGWSPTLHSGAILREKYGDRVGFRYFEEEDRGIFWSNDPRMPIGRMVRAVNLVEWPAYHARDRKIIADH